ncbi:MAG: hypothetical protein GY842_24660 [bacterium]|nr:hypothetical protein [bacterium]
MVELLLALAITGLVSAAITSMLMAVSHGTSSRRDLRTVVTRGRVLDSRLTAAVRGSRAVLENGTDYLILWSGDVNTNGTQDAPDLSEIRLIERLGTGIVKSYAFPDDWTQAQIDAADESYALSGNPAGFFRTETSDAKTAKSFTGKRWALDVTEMTFQLNATDPASITLVSYRLSLQAGELAEQVVGAASPRYTSIN